jgi:acyl-CoA thioesterase FadM
VPHVGSTSCTLVYDIYRASDGARAATIRHVCVVTDLAQMKKMPIPEDVRAVLAANASGASG